VAKYLVLYRADTAAAEQMAAATPEQQQAGMDAWMAWAGRAGGAIIELGAPLRPGGHLGPGPAASQDVAGFTILEADSAQELDDILTGHPHLNAGGSIDVLEFLPVPGM
jgi:hypothetical protein